MMIDKTSNNHWTGYQNSSKRYWTIYHIKHKVVMFNQCTLHYRKAPGTYIRCLARSKFWRSLIQKKNIMLILQIVFKLDYLFCYEIWQNLLPKSCLQTIITLDNFINKSWLSNQNIVDLYFSYNIFHWSKCKESSSDI